MTATFGKLKGKTLTLHEGLNIIEAPNETGKSTWCAFLLSMLYGVNSRERDRAGYLADKNRYTPWDGTPSSGRMELRVGQREVTLTRDTRRPGAPMADFKAVFTGTGEPIPGLTGQNCGDALLGVSRDIFERSAFIRQSGLAIGQTPELEKRIASLITSGEEDTSYSEAADALRKQLNRRRHNRTGRIPALEAALRDRRQQLEELTGLESQLSAASAQVKEAGAQVQALEQERALCLRWEEKTRLETAEDAAEEAKRAQEQADQFRRRLEVAGIPENQDIARLRGALVNIQSTRKGVDRAREERDEAMKSVLRAEAAVNESPFAGQTVESAQREIKKEGHRLSPLVPLFLILSLAGLGGCIAAYYYIEAFPKAWFPYLLGTCGGVAAVALWQWIVHHQKVRASRTALNRRFGTTDTAVISHLCEDYCSAMEKLEAAQKELAAKSAAADSLYAALSSNEQALLLEIRRFAPDAFDLTAADELLRKCAILRKELSDADRAAQEGRIRRDVLGQQFSSDGSPLPMQEPARPREEVEQALSFAKGALTQARSSADRLSGRLHAIGDPVVLRSELAHMEQELGTLQAEYDALSLAAEALDSANASLQSRFSPALGKRTAEIFRQLTGDRYQAVTLDRALNLSVQPEADALQRDAGFLSAGALDQLYLAARLAICELVLPADREVPLILDDALANFDDERCEAALRWLEEASKSRQVILFTCHSRESAYFRGNCEIFVQQLTEE